MYKIGELSQLCRLPVKTLRYWADIGLLVPDEVDRFTGYRYYEAGRIADCHRIVALKELGFSLDEIRMYMTAEHADEIPEIIAAKKLALSDAAAKLNQQIRRLDAMLKTITEGEKMMYQAVIRSEDEFRAAYVRGIFKERSEAYRLLAEMRCRLPKSVQGHRNMIINYETDYRENDFDMAVCVELCGRQEIYPERSIAPGGDVASLTCPRNALEEAYRDMNAQLVSMPAQITGAFYEVYYDEDNMELKVPVVLLHEAGETVDDEMAPFEDDPDVVGMWEFCDLVPSEEQFTPGHVKYGDAAHILQKKLCFLPGGAGYWIVSGWTKGRLYTTSGYPKYRFAHEYTITERDGETYLYLKRWSHSIRRRGGQPEIHVYRKLDSLAHTAEDMRIRDEVDLPFVSDERIIGRWRAIDLVHNRSEYVPGKSGWMGELFWKSTEFLPDGTAVDQFGDSEYRSNWTRGTMLDRRRMTAQAYELCEIDGQERLFIQWKSGDYLYAGRIQWYVFERA